MNDELREKKKVALAQLRKFRGVVVALSGGVDSAVLLALALEAAGPDRVLAVTGLSPSLPDDDLRDAREVARFLGAHHENVETRETELPLYRANRGDRCFHCRSELFDVVRKVADSRGYGAVVYGAIRDDAGDFRPGMTAATERGVLAPLLDAGIGKKEVRVLAADYGLKVRDKPAAACLASRIPVGTEVTPERLARIGDAEKRLKDMGFLQVRVRDHGDVARVELAPEEMGRLEDPMLRVRVVEAIKTSGFRYVALDLEGYRTGSLNPL